MNLNLSKNLKILLNSTNKQIIEKNQIKCHCAILSDWVDYVLIADSFNICIRNFFNGPSFDLNLYGNFTNYINTLNISNGKKFYFIILIKSNDSTNNFFKSNGTNNSDKYNKIFSNPFELVNNNFEYLFEIKSSNIFELLNKLICLFYSNNIFLYDYEGSALMIDFID